MNSIKYWEKRQVENYRDREKDILYFYRNLENAFNQSKREIEMIINDFFVRYSENNKISYSDAKKLISKEEIKTLNYFINKVYKSVGANDKEIINISLKARLSRFEALQKQIEAVLDVLYEVEYKQGGIEKLKEVYRDSYYNTLYNMDTFKGFHAEFSTLNIRDVEALIEYPFNGANYSDRIWKQKDHMVAKLKENVTTMLVQGKNPKEFTNDFAKTFNVKKNEAYRLLHTESSFIIEQGTLAAYKEDGVEEYQILATLDTKTSEICREQDNKVYKIEEYVTGVTAPPFHNYCRSTTIPYYGDYEGTRKARDPKTNKTYDVPANMSYTEWYKKYIDNMN